MVTIDRSEEVNLHEISTSLKTSLAALRRVYLRIKLTGKATAFDLNQLLALKVPIYQAVFAFMKSQPLKNQDDPNEIEFLEIKEIFISLTALGGLLHQRKEVKARNTFSSLEAGEIKKLLLQARDCERKERHEILTFLRTKYQFFSTNFTESRVRFDHVKFNELVLSGDIIINS